MNNLDGKVVLVTGSSKGLGRHFALNLAKSGATVIVNNRSGGDAANAVIEEIRAEGNRADLFACDIGDPESVEAMVDQIISKHGKIDILINNAGISVDSTTVKISSDNWDRVLRTNLCGCFYCSKYCLPAMLDQKWGRILNISSVVAQMGVFGTPAYSASKSALTGFTKTLAKEVARKGVTVNVISLGYFRGGGLLDTVPEKLAQEILTSIPVGRWGKPEEIVGAIRYLASDLGGFITGQTININGGIYM